MADERPPSLFTGLGEDYSPSALVLSDSNRETWRRLEGWRSWPGGALAMVGPPGSGKTYFGQVWRRLSGAGVVGANAAPEAAADAFSAHAGRLFLDDVDRALDDESVFLLLELAKAKGGAVLFAAERSPHAWPSASPDLASRLSALPVTSLKDADEALLAGVLRHLCRQYFIKLDDDVALYLIQHMERSLSGARRLAAAINQQVVRGRGPLSKPIARRALAAAGYAAFAGGSAADEGENDI